MARIVIISGSPSGSSRLNGLLQEAKERIRQSELQADEIIVSELPPEALIRTRFDDPAIIEANRLVAQADAVIVATPVYKASYTGVLKTFLDLIPQKGLENKPVLPLAIGGTLAHLLVLDYALKPVLSALGASHILNGVFAVDTQVTRLDPAGFELESELKSRLGSKIEELLQAVPLSSGQSAVEARSGA